MVVICRYYICKWKLFVDIGVSIEKKHVKGGGLLYGGYLQILYLQIKLFVVITVQIEKKTRKGRRSTIWLFIRVDLLNVFFFLLKHQYLQINFY